MITLRRPSKKNAITHDMYREMSRAIDTAQNNPDIRCMIITGGSGVFTAGDDIDDFMHADTSRPETLSDGAKFLYSLALNAKPVIAAVDGASIGVGTAMLFHCDYVLASNAATFSAPYIHLGLVPVGAASLLMPNTMGYQRAFAMLVMGRTYCRGSACRRLRQHRGLAGTYRGRGAQGGARDLPAARRSGRDLAQTAAHRAEELTRRIDQEAHLFGERLKSEEAIAAFNAFANRKKR